VSTSLKSALDRLTIAGNESSDRAQAQAYLKTALIIAKAGGGMPDEQKLGKALDELTKPSEALFSTFSDYQRDFYKTANDIREIL
jgi:tellurite resistance protein